LDIGSVASEVSVCNGLGVTVDMGVAPGVAFSCGVESTVSIPLSDDSSTHPDNTAAINTADNINVVVLLSMLFTFFF